MPQTQYNLHLKGFVGGADFDRNYVDYVLAKNAGKPKGRFFWFTFGICMVRIRYADQKLLCLQWKCGLGLKMTLSVDARRGFAPCRWAFPGVLFIIKKMLERNFGNFEKKIILTTKTIPTMQRNKKTFK